MRALLSAHTTHLIAGMADKIAAGIPNRILNDPSAPITLDESTHTARYNFITGLPLNAIQANIQMLKEAMSLKPVGDVNLTDTPNANVPYIPLFTAARSLQATMRVYAAMAQAHDPQNYDEHALKTASQGIGKPIGKLPPTTPAVLIRKDTYEKIVAAEMGEQHGKIPPRSGR